MSPVKSAASSAATLPDPMPTRDRLVTAASQLLARHGYPGTGVKAILAAGKAPFGSLYHHFPGGKEELGAAAIAASGEGYRSLVASYFSVGADPVDATRSFFEGAARLLEATGYEDACPLAMVALETANESEPLRAASHTAFESWLSVVHACLVAAGVDGHPARELAVELFCAVEGAFLLCRTARSTEALEVTGRAAVASVAAAVTGGAT